MKNTFRLRNQGAQATKIAHCQGYADGYMRLLLDAGHVTEEELLGIVSDARRGVDGPATCPLPESEQVLIA